MTHFSIKNLLFVATAAWLLSSCAGESEDPQINQMDFDLLAGKWSITREVQKNYDQSGNVQDTNSQDFDINTFTVEFLSATRARIIQVEEGMWALADYALNTEDSTLSLSFSFGDEAIDILLKVVALSETSATLFEEGTEEYQGNIIEYENTLTLIKNGSDVATISKEQLQVKWSAVTQSMLRIADENGDGEFNETAEVIMDMELADIPYNRFSLEFLEDSKMRVIDSYRASAVNEAATWEILDESNIIVNDMDMGQTLVHIQSFDGSLLQAIYIGFEEEEISNNTTQIMMKGELAMQMNDGSEPALSEVELTGSWTITDFVELLDGQDVTAPDNPIGATISFNEDGTGLLIMGQENVELTWKCVDESNFSFTGLLDGDSNEPETVLLNIKSYNDASGTLSVVEGGMDIDFGTGNQILYESRIELVKNS